MSNITNKKKIAQLIIARLDGKDINKKFKYYESLVKKGIGGFIVFGGKAKEVSRAIKKLQGIAHVPLFIASDLEQGLGQQIEGGTLFPPAMAIGEAISPRNRKEGKLLKKFISTIAREAKAVGINIILSPVLDVNTNPKNPIICTRAFSDNPQKVAWFGKKLIKGFQKYGLIACAKHFPGHGDTSVDSHKELPAVKVNMERLQNVELCPFIQAIKAGVKMIMIGHLRVPVLDSKYPSSLSQKTIKGLLREKMKFKGLVITDAMNMKAIKYYKEEKACLMALKAGADMMLHPSKPERVIDYLASKYDEIESRVEESFLRVLKAKKDLLMTQDSTPNQAGGRIQDIGTKSSWDLAYKLTQKSIKIKLKENRGQSPKQIVILILDDDNNKSGAPFVNTIKKKYKKIKTFYVDNKTTISPPLPMGELKGDGKILIIAVFSKISAGKGRSGLSRKLHAILEKTVRTSRYSVIAGFCCPYFLDRVKAHIIIKAYSDSELTQKAVGKILIYL